MVGRESKENNDIFFTCSLIEFMARKTRNTSTYIAEKLGEKYIKKIYDLADVYHCENIEKVSDEFIQIANIEIGSEDYFEKCNYSIPTYWDIGKVYKRLINGIRKEKEMDLIEAFIWVYKSKMSLSMNNYNSSFYYENPSYILQVFLENKML